MRRHFCEHILDDFFYHNKPLLYTDIVKDRGFLCQLLTQLYSDLNTTNNNLSNSGIPIVKKITDLYSIKTSGFYYYDAGAMNAPLSSRGGMIIANYLSDSWISLIVVPYASSKIYTNTKYNNTWVGWAESATKDDLPNIFTAQLGTSNLEGNHATTIKGLWNSFPENQVFACNLTYCAISNKTFKNL